MNASKMSAISKYDVLEWAAYHLAIYAKHAPKSELVTQISHFLHRHYRGIAIPSKPNSPVRQPATYLDTS